jgi:7-cyano-7-deazaguanine synthase in queuosine biosynthesis
MKFNVVIKAKPDDGFLIAEDNLNKTVGIGSIMFPEEQQLTVFHDILKVLKRDKLTPSDTLIDLANICIASYGIDQLISRREYGHYSWSRYFKLHIPVVDLALWRSLQSELEVMLSFLSGDRWELSFREREAFHKEYQREESPIKGVCLFSGGLDSFIGAVDLLSEMDNLCLVSHHKSGGGGDFAAQKELVALIKNKFTAQNITHSCLYIQADQQNNPFEKEDTQRARSILFIGMGLLMANSIGDNIPLYVPENGLISLNVPLTKTRFGSFSTRTTHPNFISLFQQLIAKLGMNNKILNPYSFSTKGEMLINSSNKDFIAQNSTRTISCAKPGYYIRYRGKSEKHCGHCAPCIIRRAAMKKAGIDNAADYALDVVGSRPPSTEEYGRDYNAFKIAINRVNQIKSPLFFELLKAGPVPGNAQELKSYTDVYKRGIAEVQALIS